MKTFMLVYSWPQIVNAADLLRNIGVSKVIEAWNGLVFFKGPFDASFYANKLHEAVPAASFIITEYDPAGRSYGWMPQNIWEWAKT
jgi:hypothetical protein